MKILSAHQLSLTHRFDIFAKHLYARMREPNIDSQWYEELYAELVRILNGFIQNNGSGKHENVAIYNSLNELLDSIKHHEYSSELSAKNAFSPSYQYVKRRTLKFNIRYFLYRAYYALKSLLNRGSP